MADFGRGRKLSEFKVEAPVWGKKIDDMCAPSKATEYTLKVSLDTNVCTQCGSAANVAFLKTHPGTASAFEWVYGIDIDWRWHCCGKHEDFHCTKPCDPAGAHPQTGCMTLPVCSSCFVCSCKGCREIRKKQEDDF